MTERTVAKQSLKDDEDSISITSTQESETNEERSYVVDRILAEQDDGEGNIFYLIKWDGYQLLASTWEPAENIESQAILDEWDNEKTRIDRGFSDAFDVAVFDEEIEKLALAKSERRSRREAKRERLGLATSLLESKEEISPPTPENESIQHNVKPVDAQKGSEAAVQNQSSKPSKRDRESKPESSASKGASKQNDTSDGSEESSVNDVRQDVRNIGKRRVKGMTRRNALTFLTDDDSSSDNATAFDPMRGEAKVKASSVTGYKGTANRGSSAVSLGRDDPSTGATTRGRGRGRPHSGGRGRGRGGGGDQQPPKVDRVKFTGTGISSVTQKRKRSLANALLNAPMLDSNKPIEHFKTPSMVRKAELAGRSLADRAPDMESVGPLSIPSEYGGIRPIRKRPQALRRDSESTPGEQNLTAQVGESINDGYSSPPQGEVVVAQNKEFSEGGQETALRTKRASQLQAEITERTAQISLRKTGTSNEDRHPQLGPVTLETMAETSIRNRDLPEGTPTGPRALVQAQAKTVAQELDIPDANIMEEIKATNAASEESHFASTPVSDKTSDTMQQSGQPLKPVTKINLKEYTSRRMSEFLGDAISAQVIFGSKEATPVLIGFTDIDKAAKQSWVETLRRLAVLTFDRTCVAQDFQAHLDFIQRGILAQGNIISSIEGAIILEEIAEWLRPLSGLVFSHTEFSILMFPAKCEEWKFLDTGPVNDHGSSLRFRIFEAKYPNDTISKLDNAFTESIMPSLDLKRHYLDNLVDLIQGLNYETFLPTHPEGADVHNFYLIFPQKATSSAKFVARWLRSCNPGCRLYTNQKLGSWDIFVNNPTFRAGVIILHGSLLPSIFKIPHLAQLIHGNASFGFWSMNDGSNASPFHPDFNNGDHTLSCETSMTRLFPHGGAVLLAPSFLITEPERAYDFIKWFQKKVSTATAGTWKLVLSNDCRQYLLDLAVEKATERSKLYDSPSVEQTMGNLDIDLIAARKCLTHEQCKARFNSYILLDQLLKRDYIAGSLDYGDEDYLEEIDSPIVYADKSIDQNDEKGLVTWFAGWSVLHVNLFRKFLVVGTSPSRTLVYTPTAESVGSGTVTPQGPRVITPIMDISPKPSASQAAGPSVTTSKGWKRNTFPEVKDPSPSMPGPPDRIGTRLVATTETSIPSNDGAIDQTENVEIDLGNDEVLPSPTLRDSPHLTRGPDSRPKASRQESFTRHGIDESKNPSILKFIGITGEDVPTAEKYLMGCNNDVATAVQKYYYSARRSSSPLDLPQFDGFDELEDPAAVLDFITSTNASVQVAETHLHMTKDDARRAVELYKESHQMSRSPSGTPGKQKNANEISVMDNYQSTARAGSRAEATRQTHQIEENQGADSSDIDNYSPEELLDQREREHEEWVAFTEETDGNYVKDFRSSLWKPGQSELEDSVEQIDMPLNYDGADERQGADGNRTSRRSGIVTDTTDNRQFVPRSVRPSGSMRPEISIRPGYVPPEDRAIYRNRRVIGGIPQYEFEERTNSGSGSRNSSVIHSPVKDTRGQSLSDNGVAPGVTQNTVHVRHDFETTVEWYEKLNRNGQGWTHIYVAGWEQCFKSLKIKSK